MEGVAFGELTASRRVPSGVIATGCTCGLSKCLTMLAAGAGSELNVCAEARCVPRPNVSEEAVSARARAIESVWRKRLRIDNGGSMGVCLSSKRSEGRDEGRGKGN